MKRLITALVLIPLVMWLVLAGPQWAFLLAIALVGLAAFHEFDTIAGAQGIEPSGFVGMAGGLVLLLVPEPAMPILVVIGLALMTQALRVTDLRQSLPSAAVGMLGIVYIFGAWRSGAMLRAINPHWLMLALLVSWAGDSAAMYVGKSLGRNKLAPRVSPGKTWEGSVGSVVGGLVGGAIYAHYSMPQAPLLHVLLISGIANVAGQMGDLCESAFKRGAGIKDSGTMLPGHGGWLDRVDSSLFAIPATYATLLLLTGS